MSISDDKLGAHGDTFYNTLMEAHDGLSDVESHRLNARLVLMMANHIGDLDAISALMSKARGYAND